MSIPAGDGNAVAGNGQVLHLIVDSLFPPASLEASAPADEPRGGPTLPAIRVPGQPSSLSRPARGGSTVVLNVISTAADVPDDRVIVEPIYGGQEARLVMLMPAGSGCPVRVNGIVPPRVCLLRIGDQVLFGNDVVLHLTAYNVPRLGRAEAAQVGTECLLCRVVFRSGDTVYVCPCGAAAHCMSTGDDRSGRDTVAGAENTNDGVPEEGEEALECAKLLSACPRCSRPIVLVEGFEYVPEPC